MKTKINKAMRPSDNGQAIGTIYEALDGEWGMETLDGLTVIRIGKAAILNGVFASGVSAVNIPAASRRSFATFHDLQGHTNAVVIEAGAKFVKKPSNIVGGFVFSAIV